MHLPYPPIPMPPPTTTRPALHRKWTTTKTAYPQAHEREHYRQQKISWRQCIKQTLRRLRKSDNLFLDNSTTHAKDKHTAITKNDTNNAKYVAIDSVHAQRNQPTIRLAQRDQNTAYHLGLAFDRTIKKLNMSVLPNRRRYTYSMPL
jgi:hypothetical protein